MSNNQTFSLSRMLLLCRRDLSERWRQHLVSIGTLLGILLVIAVMTAFNVSRWNDPETCSYLMITYELPFFIVSLFFFGCLMASTAFKSMSTPAGALSTLMLPASQFEKFLYRWIISVPLAFLLFFVCAVIADWLRVLFVDFYMGIEVSTIDWGKLIFHSADAGFNTDAASWIVLLIFFMTQSFFLVGSVVWRRSHFVKTFFSMFVITLIYGRVAVWIYDLFHKEDLFYGAPPLLDNDKTVFWSVAILMTVISLFNYLLTYLRFRESEIINRW
ncbi:hypothetical protein [uncultured Duncaniella sp.]|uniref:hypothetical protein n=2 Tax=uncultured Duncaniella sp. TaxID=2768039 RepID=UPI00260A8FBC|nr:hypothetical protein [uncultured Duncaniella sp.]